MTTKIFTFPTEWHEFVMGPGKFRPRSMSQVFNRTWSGGRNVSGPVSKIWTADITIAPTRDPDRMAIQAFLDRLNGMANALRMPDTTRLAPWYDRNGSTTKATFSDDSTFTDGSGFANGHLPPEVYVNTAAALGADYFVLGGFPASTANVLRGGDLLEIKPNGIAAAFPHLYEVMVGGDSDASGNIGITITPNLRAGVAAGDTVSLRNPCGLFRLISDDQGEMQNEDAGVGRVSFSLIEALDLVA